MKKSVFNKIFISFLTVLLTLVSFPVALSAEENDPIIYTVTFDNNGLGQSIDPLYIEENNLISKPQDLVEDGYLFEGWYLEESLNTPWDFDNDVVEQDTTLYAKWSMLMPLLGAAPTSTLTVRYLDTDDNLISTESVSYGGKLQNIPSKENYLTGIYTRKKKTTGLIFKKVTYVYTEINKESLITSDMDLYVKYLSTEDLDKQYDFKVDNVNGDVVCGGYSYYNYDTNVEYQMEYGGKTYQGSTFDLAIQEADDFNANNEHNTITLLHNLTIRQPLEIWGNINLNLNGYELSLVKEGLIVRVVKFVVDVLQEIFFGRVFNIEDCVIFVNNATTKIYNGTIRNEKLTDNNGIIVYSSGSTYFATLENVYVNVGDFTGGNYSVKAGYECLVNGQKHVLHGNVSIISGKYKANIKRYINTTDGRDGYLLLAGGEYANDPLDGTNATLTDNNMVFRRKGLLVLYRYYVDSGAVAMINSDGYTSVSSAVSAVASNETIVLKNDFSTSSLFNINPNSNNYTFDTCGYVVSGSTINVNSGTVTFINSELEGNFEAPISVTNNGKAIINSGFYTSVSKSDTSSSLTITGGYFKEDVSAYIDSREYVCTDLGSGNEVNGCRYKVSRLENAEEAKINDTKYFTLQEAITSANANDEIILLSNVLTSSTYSINKNLTINLDNYSIESIADMTFDISNGAAVTIKGNSKDTNFIYNKSTTYGALTGIRVDNTSELTLNNLTYSIDNSTSYSLTAIENNNKLTINKSKVYAGYANGIVNFIKNNIGATLNTSSANIEIDILPSVTDACVIDNLGVAYLNKGSVYSFIETVQGVSASYTANVYGIMNSGTLNMNEVDTGFKNNGGSLCGIYCYGQNPKLVMDGAGVTVDQETTASGMTYAVYVSPEATGFDGSIKNYSQIMVRCQKTGFGLKVLPTTVNELELENATVFVYGKDNTTGIETNLNSDLEINNCIVKTMYPDSKVTVSDNERQLYCLSSNSSSKLIINGADSYYACDAIDYNKSAFNNVLVKAGHFKHKVDSSLLDTNLLCVRHHVVNPILRDDYYYEVINNSLKINASVTNDSELIVNIKVNYPQVMLDNPDEFGIRITFKDAKTYKLTDGTLLADGRYKYTISVPAKEMDRNIMIEIVGLENSQVTDVYKTVSTYSVKQYCNNIISKPEKYDEYDISLVKSMLDYCTYAKEMVCIANGLTVNADDLKEIANTNDNDIKAIENTQGVYSDEDYLDYLTNIGYSLNLGAAVNINFYFNLADDENINNYKFYIDGVEKKVTTEKGVFKVEGPEIYSSILDRKFKVKITRTVNGQTKIFEDSYSTLEYAKDCLLNDNITYSFIYQNFARALYNYYVASLAYVTYKLG